MDIADLFDYIISMDIADLLQSYRVRIGDFWGVITMHVRFCTSLVRKSVVISWLSQFLLSFQVNLITKLPHFD